jgi:cysteine synthase A
MEETNHLENIFCGDVLNQIGRGALVELPRINKTNCKILAKSEVFNPSGSVKDVMAFYMVCQAESKGILKRGTKIIEVTTGNTGIAFSMISAIRGYEFTAVMPEHMSIERRKMMEAFGAEIILTRADDDLKGAIRRFRELASKYPDAWLPNQFGNPDNIIAHKEITGKSILEQYKGKIDAFVAGVGTGGTLMGVALALKKVHPDIKIIAVEPAESAVMSGGEPKIHNIQGIGEGFIPDLVKMDIIDQVIVIKTEDAMNMMTKIAREEGLMVGISSGANVLASIKLAEKSEKSKTIVTILPDRGERYLSLKWS